MPADARRITQDRWCDVEGTPIALFCWVEQVTERPEHEALFSRLHRRGEVIGRGPDVLYVRFAGDGQMVVSVAPDLVRLLPGGPDERRW